MSRPTRMSQRRERKNTNGQKPKAELQQEDLEILRSIRNSWRQTVVSLYPNLHCKPHFLPPVYFNHERFRETTFAGQRVLIDQQQTFADADVDAANNQPAFPVPESEQPSGLSFRDTKTLTLPTDTASSYRHNSASSALPKQGKRETRSADARPADPRQPTESSLAGSSVLWPSQSHAVGPQRWVQESTLREDFAQQHILHCLQALAEKRNEVMFVISQLKFSDYLSHPCYAATTALFPRFSDIQNRYRDGDFDVLVIHRRCGILVGEIKSVGLNPEHDEKPQHDLKDDVIAKRVEKAVWQLNKSEDVLKFLLHDLSPPVIRKTLILPYILSFQLQDVLEKHDHLKTALCQCLKAGTVEDAVQQCLCSDQMSGHATPWEVTDDVMNSLSQWWQRMTCHHDYFMTDDIYADIVARFCGPATTVRIHWSSSPLLEIRSESQAVSEVGNRLRRLVLTPEQINLLVEAPPRIFLTGPVGTGKTVLLVLMALQWLRQGQDVHVVCSWALGLAASYLVHHQLQMTMQACQISSQATGRIFFHCYNFQGGETEVAKSVADLLTFAKNQNLHIVMDEVYLDPNNDGIDAAPLAKLYNQFVEGLLASASGLHLWMAGAMHNCIPHGLDVRPLLVPLRCVPVVQRMMMNTVDFEMLNVHNYANRICLPCDGPRIIKLTHAGDGHIGKWPLECWQCGCEIADVLLQHLQIGSSKLEGQAPSAHSDAGRKCSTCTSPLQFRDVFVLTHGHLHDEEITDDNGQQKLNTNRLTLGLRDAGVPVHVVRDYRDHGMTIWKEDLKEVILRKEDKVTLAEWNDVFSLERKVVIYIPGRKDDPDKQFSNEKLEIWGKMISLSRCIAQLITVHVPADDTHLSCQE